MKHPTILVAALAISMLYCMSSYPQTQRAPAVQALEVRPFLQRFTDTYSTHAENYFFVSDVVNVNDGQFVYVYWMTGNTILIADLADVEEEDVELYDRKKRVDLVAEVVPTEGDIRGSNHLVSSNEVQRMLKLCIGGKKFVVKRRANKPLQPIAPKVGAPVER
jgi:hypothetical protein